MTTEDLANCIPSDKHDHAAVARAAALGFPGLNPILGDLLEWIQDANWPIAPDIAALLTGAGPEIVPHISAILRGTDGMWKYWTIELVVAQSSDEIFQAMRPDLGRLSDHPTPDDRDCEADLAARAALDTRPGL